MDWQADRQYFRKMVGKKASWTISQPDGGLVRAGYPRYDQQLLSFIRRYKASSCYDHRYRKTLRHYHVKPKMTVVTVSQVLLIGNARAVGAMLSLIVDGEDVQPGTWAAAMQKGHFYHLLVALDADDKVAE